MEERMAADWLRPSAVYPGPMAEKKSHALRALDSPTLRSLGKLTIKKGIDAATCGFGGDLFEWALDHQRRGRERRVAAVAEALGTAIENTNDEIALDAEMVPDVLYAILKNAVNDDEEEKAEIYAKLLVAIQANKLDRAYQRHAIRVCRELRFSDFALMRELYVRANVLLSRHQTKASQVGGLIDSPDSMTTYGLETFRRFGLLAPSELHRTSVWPTEFFTVLVEMLFDRDELLADAITKQARTRNRERVRVVLAADLSDENVAALGWLERHLDRREIRSTCLDFRELSQCQQKRARLTCIAIPVVAICTTREGCQDASVQTHLNVEKRNVVYVMLPGGEQPEQGAFHPVFDLREQSESEVDRLVEYIRERTGELKTSEE